MSTKQIFVLAHPQARRNAAYACMNAPVGYRVEVREKTRSLAQNDLLWSILTDLAKQVPWTVNGKQEMLTGEDWKAILTASLAQEQRMATGVRGGFVFLPRSTSRMTVRQLTELIDFAHSFGAEHDVQWSETSVGREFA